MRLVDAQDQPGHGVARGADVTHEKTRRKGQ